jgi:predicted Zn-dependent protease with MMP-like domain
MTTGRSDRLGAYRAAQRRFRPDRGQFERLVAEALASLPHEFRARLDNVALVVEDWPSPGLLQRQGLDPESDTLLGFYEGTPLGQRGSAYHLATPDRIILFRGPILAAGRTRAQVVREVRETVMHEVGHYFGLAEHELH